MGHSPIHERLFFKFQYISTTNIDIALEVCYILIIHVPIITIYYDTKKAFPNTSWAFIYRKPVQTMMSHLDPKKMSGGAPCLRSMRNPPKEV
jgi:hypothetical protein